MSIICLGELIIDFFPNISGNPLWKVDQFKKSVGGAPANVAIGLHHHQIPVSFRSKVGSDSLGQFLKNQLQNMGLSVHGIAEDNSHRTKLALVGMDNRGDRTFEFHNLDSAERYITADDIDFNELSQANIFHFGGVALLGDLTAKTTFTILEETSKSNCLVSCDPNIRLDIAGHPAHLKSRLLKAIQYVDVLKVNREEYRMIFDDADPEQVAANSVSLLIITDGSSGSRFYTKQLIVDIPAAKTKVVDTTGAGDAFTAAVLAKLYKMMISEPDKLSESQIIEIGNFANEWASRCIRLPGAITAYLTKEGERH